jgi:mRNA-degrading endonuclease RelE of RelBE toxin-antitoxin system
VKAAVVIATPKYERQVVRLLAESERAAMEDAISSNPEGHPVVPGTGGVRKARWGRQGKGKRGGVRVIYYYLVAGATVFMLSVYSKNEQSDMTPEGRKLARSFVEGVKKCQPIKP